MSSQITSPRDAERIAYEKGRNVGLAIGALALSVIAYINLLGIEKSLLAIVLAILALQNAGSLSMPRFRAQLALALASIHAVTVIVIVVVFRDKLAELARRVIELLHSLS